MAEATCSIEGCARRARARGWCKWHWQRWSRNGDPLVVQRVVGDDAERLRSHLRIEGDGCWPFMPIGSRDSDGYGRLKVGARYMRAHRLTYELWVSPIPAGLLVLHSCDNPPCCNPAHLFLGTNADNMADKASKGRSRNKWTGPL